jgi:hypothetical protein
VLCQWTFPTASGPVVRPRPIDHVRCAT